MENIVSEVCMLGVMERGVLAVHVLLRLGLQSAMAWQIVKAQRTDELLLANSTVLGRTQLLYSTLHARHVHLLGRVLT